MIKLIGIIGTIKRKEKLMRILKLLKAVKLKPNTNLKVQPVEWKFAQHSSQLLEMK